VNKNITRKYLSNKIHKNLGFPKNLSSEILDNFFEQIILEILISNKIKISSFGTFSILKKKERMGRNPKNKIKAIISSRKVVKFKPSQLLKNRLNKNEI
jgi:integration host factor subunit alpha